MLTLAEARRWSGWTESQFCAKLAACAAEGVTGLERFGSVQSFSGELTRSPRILSHAAMRRLVPPGASPLVLTVGIQKGGVGKTVVALNLAVALAMAGLRVLFIDCDPQASASNFLLPEDVNYDHLLTTLEVCHQDVTFAQATTPTRYAGLDLVAAKPAIRKVDARLRGADAVAFLRGKLAAAPYECVVFDVPPGFGDLVRGAYLLSSQVVMPVLPDVWSIESAALTRADIADAAHEAGVAQPHVNLLLNRFRPGRIASADALSVLEENDRDLILPMTLPETAAVQNSVNNGLTVLEGSATLLREAFLELAGLLWQKAGANA